MFPLWRLVVEKVASKSELESWTIEDVADANDMLDFMAAQQAANEERARAEAAATRERMASR